MSIKDDIVTALEARASLVASCPVDAQRLIPPGMTAADLREEVADDRHLTSTIRDLRALEADGVVAQVGKKSASRWVLAG